MLGIGREVSVFLSACLAGNLVCLGYMALRILRRIIRHSLFWVSLEDFLFWILAALYLFSEMYRTCFGSIRWYFVLGVVGGGALTYFLVEKLMKKYVDKSRKKE